MKSICVLLLAILLCNIGVTNVNSMSITPLTKMNLYLYLDENIDFQFRNTTCTNLGRVDSCPNSPWNYTYYVCELVQGLTSTFIMSQGSGIIYMSGMVYTDICSQNGWGTFYNMYQLVPTINSQWYLIEINGLYDSESQSTAYTFNPLYVMNQYNDQFIFQTNLGVLIK